MRYVRPLGLFIAGVMGALISLGLAAASASSANISYAYHASSSITSGSIVSVDPSHANYVQPASTNNGSRLVGIAVAGNDSLVAVDQANSTVQVATTGVVNTLVSTLDGDIKVGDQIGVSPFNGIGMKALPGSQVIGLAQTAFSRNTSGAVTQQVTNKSGRTATLQVGYIAVSISAGTTGATGTTANLNSLQRLAKSLTGHVISTARIVLSLIIAIVTILALIVLIYASIFGGVVSIGRNPLAKYAVFRTLGVVSGMTALLTIVASLIIFLLLR